MPALFCVRKKFSQVSLKLNLESPKRFSSLSQAALFIVKIPAKIYTLNQEQKIKINDTHGR